MIVGKNPKLENGMVQWLTTIITKIKIFTKQH